MSLIRNKNMTDLAFYRWINGFPTSGHQLDWWRFLGFITIERRYRCQKYSTYEKFRQECLVYSSGLREENIEQFWKKKQKVENFLDDLRNAEAPMLYESCDTQEYGHYVQRNVIDHKLYCTRLTEEEYLAGGISPAEVKRRGYRAT